MLNLDDLGKGNVQRISPRVGAFWAEAGSVCLESQGHTQGVRLTVQGYYNNSYALTWPPITEQFRQFWGDPEYATEHGALGIAVLIAKEEIGYEIVRQSRKGTGFDYWMGTASDEGFVNKAGLEISGIREGDDSIIKARVRQKLQQTDQSDHTQLEIYVIVVEFGRPLAEVEKK